MQLLPVPIITVISCFILLFVAGCQTGPRPAAEFVQQAQFLHDNALQSAAVRDRDLDGYFSDLGKRIIAGATAVDAANTKDPTLAAMQFHLVASGVVNAYGTGGGHIYIYDGLLQLCENEEDLAALMAVQYAHALDLDVQKTGMQPIVGGGATPLEISRVVFLFVNAPFSGTQFLAADRRAYEIFARAGWDPAKFPEVYERLRIRGLEYPPTTGADGKPRPLLLARASAARALRETLSPQSRDWRQPNVADADSFKEVKTMALKLSQQVKPADRGLLYLAAFPNVILPSDLSEQQQAQGFIRKELAPPPPLTPKIEPS